MVYHTLHLFSPVNTILLSVVNRHDIFQCCLPPSCAMWYLLPVHPTDLVFLINIFPVEAVFPLPVQNLKLPVLRLYFQLYPPLFLQHFLSPLINPPFIAQVISNPLILLSRKEMKLSSADYPEVR